MLYHRTGRNIAFGLVIGLLLLTSSEARSEGSYSWNKTANWHSGLYANDGQYVTQGISINFSGLYYFGDAESMGFVLNGGFNVKNFSVGGALRAAYNYPMGSYCNLRTALSLGVLDGNNEAKFRTLGRDDFRSFHSWFILPSVGVEVYPFKSAGFYLYGGIGLSITIIDKFKFYHYIKGERTLIEGSTYGFLPMFQVGLGYNWILPDSWTLGIEIMGNMGMMDMPYANLDAYPLAASQNDAGVAIGTSTISYTNSNGEKKTHWTDGWFQVGITATYRW